MDKPKINLSTIFAFSCLILAFAFMFYTVQMTDTAALSAMRMFVLGTVGATAINYILGSSKSSQNKDATISDAIKASAITKPSESTVINTPVIEDTKEAVAPDAAAKVETLTI